MSMKLAGAEFVAATPLVAEVANEGVTAMPTFIYGMPNVPGRARGSDRVTSRRFLELARQGDGINADAAIPFHLHP